MLGRRWRTCAPCWAASAKISRWSRPAQVQVPDVIGRRGRVARAQLEAAGLQVNQQQAPVGDPQQAGRVVFQSPPAGTTVGRGTTVTIVIGFRLGDDGGGGNGNG